MRVSVAGRAS